MPTPPPERATAQRPRLLADLLRADRNYAAAAAAFQASVTAERGLTAAEHSALDLLNTLGPLTPRQLADHTGLAPASISGVIDRLVAKDLIRRAAHPSDGRTYTLHPIPGRLNEVIPTETHRTQALTKLAKHYTNQQLATIVDYLSETGALIPRSPSRP